MSLVWWWSGEPLPPLKLWATGVAESCSTIKAPLTLILTLPGCIMVLSISAVVVAVLGLPICSTSTAESWTALAPRLVSPLVMTPATPGPDTAGITWSPVCDGWAVGSVMVPAYRRDTEVGRNAATTLIFDAGERYTMRCASRLDGAGVGGGREMRSLSTQGMCSARSDSETGRVLGYRGSSREGLSIYLGGARECDWG